MAAFIFNETPWVLSGYFICTAETIRIIDHCSFTTLSYHQPALTNPILKLSGSTVDYTAHNYIWIRPALERNRNIHYCAVNCSSPTTDTNTHGRGCDHQRVTGAAVKRKSMFYLDREEVRKRLECIGKKWQWYLERGDTAGKEQYNQGIHWMDGRWDICDLRFWGIERIDGGLFKMHISPLFCAVIWIKGNWL